MRNRRLTRAEAVEEYLVYQIKLFEYLNCCQAVLDIKTGKYKPEFPLSRGAVKFGSTFENLTFGLFASLVDPVKMSLNVFDVWVVLYPGKAQRIVQVWKKVEPHIKLIRQFRNDVAFHANKNLRRYFETYLSFHQKSTELAAAMREFLRLATELLKEEHTALPDLGNEIDPILKKAFPGKSRQQIDRLKSIFL
jgi:hypothetical protein